MTGHHYPLADLLPRSLSSNSLAPSGLPRRGELIFPVSPLFPHPKPTTTATFFCCRSCALVAAVPVILLSPSAFLHPPQKPPSRPFNHRSTGALVPPSPLYPAGRRREEEEREEEEETYDKWAPCTTFVWSQTPSSNRRSVAPRTPRLNAYSCWRLTTPSTSTARRTLVLELYATLAALSSLTAAEPYSKFDYRIQGTDMDPDGYAEAAGNLEAQGKT
uniref:Uncharacterized protein n=1 Tax=Oryza nivara TaxID=4536 RepID=A0A0E0J9M2_ORYNI